LFEFYRVWKKVFLEGCASPGRGAPSDARGPDERTAATRLLPIRGAAGMAPTGFILD